MFKKFKDTIINEDLVTLANNLGNKKQFTIEIKNSNALNREEELNMLVIQVKSGNREKLIEQITSIYNYTGTLHGDDIVVFKKN